MNEPERQGIAVRLAFVGLHGGDQHKDQVNDDHRQLHAALADADGEAAALIARRHVQATTDIITRALRLDVPD